MAATELQELQTLAKSNAEGLAALTKSFGSLIDRLAKTPAGGHPTASQVFGLPNAITGEYTRDRGYSFIKMLGLASCQLEESEAKVEMDVARRLHQCCYTNIQGDGPYQYKGMNPRYGRGLLAPLSTSFFMENHIDRPFRVEMKQLINAGCDGADLDEMSWIRKKMILQQYGTKALSWLNELTGGAIVAPPEMGELIELLRNKEALVNAGARVVPLPPQGRMKYPRQTAASNTYWVGESSPIPASDLGTGEVTLQAKKLAVRIIAPNELIRFASPAAEALMRDDMTKSLALGLDLACLEGLGGDNRPKGIIQMANINRLTSSDARANGDAVTGPDVYRMIAAVEESNAEFETYIMRPKTLYKFYQLRTDAVAQGDRMGPYLFNLIREAQDGSPAKLGGHNVVKSTQVSQVRSKGTSSNLTYILGGMFSDALIGMFGALEFAATTMGDTSFTNDQTWVRGILSADFNVRHEAAFALIDNLDTTIG